MPLFKILLVFITFFISSLGFTQELPPFELPQTKFKEIEAKAYKEGNPDPESLYLISSYYSRGLIDPNCTPKPPQKLCKPYLSKDLIMSSVVYDQGNRVYFDQAMELLKKNDIDSKTKSTNALCKIS